MFFEVSWYGRPVWRWQNPPPRSGSLTEPFFIDSMRGTAVGQNPEQRGRKSHHPLMSFVSERRIPEYGQLHPATPAERTTASPSSGRRSQGRRGKSSVCSATTADFLPGRCMMVGWSGYGDRSHRLHEILRHAARIMAKERPRVQFDEGIERADAGDLSSFLSAGGTAAGERPPEGAETKRMLFRPRTLMSDGPGPVKKTREIRRYSYGAGILSPSDFCVPFLGLQNTGCHLPAQRGDLSREAGNRILIRTMASHVRSGIYLPGSPARYSTLITARSWPFWTFRRFGFAQTKTLV